MMMDAIDRRSALAVGLASVTTACASCPEIKSLGPLAPGEQIIGDAHAHLFNAADLPVAGFLEYVLLPNYLDGLKPLWPALIALSRVLKALASTASAEQQKLFPPWGSGDTQAISVETYVNVIADEIERRKAARATGPLKLNAAETDLATSHALLALLLAEVDVRDKGLVGPMSVGLEDAATSDAVRVDRALLARITRGGAAAVDSPLKTMVLPRALFTGTDVEMRLSLAGLLDGVKWLHAMIQSRCSHVHQYLNTLTAPGTRTTRLINLLVDYDAWLDDAPTRGSDIEAQIRFWTRYRRAVSARVTIETFAPYDPLRHVEDGFGQAGGERYLDKLKRWAAGDPASDIAISGFKLYPPMGFKAAGNAGPPPCDRAGGVIRRRWRDDDKIAQFGSLIEQALDQFFDFCGDKAIPIVAHARASNNAWANGGQLASPEFWLDRVRKSPKPLRISLAHFSPRQFGKPLYEKILRYNRTGPSSIYFDLGYADELLDGRSVELMHDVAEVCAVEDQDCRWFMFGTDWIMLGQEGGTERYIPNLRAAAKRVAFWNEEANDAGQRRLDNLLHRNLDSFLRLPQP